MAPHLLDAWPTGGTDTAGRRLSGQVQPFTAKRLYADHRTDHIAVNVQVAHLGVLGHLGDSSIRDCRPVDRAFAMFEVIKDRLFNEPVRCAIHLLCGVFDTLVGDFVEFHAHCGSAHTLPTPV